jgi:iron complex outermembrane receptor protein
MKNSRTGRSAALEKTAPTGIRFTPIALACATLLLAGGQAIAQQQPESEQTVVVTGIRRSIESSIAVKRNADSIVEAVSSEDIGRLPETSIAESLARLPGVTAQRVNGRDQILSIRGLDERFAVTLLNGREMVSTGDSRSVEFDQFPAELINGAVVYKTPDAALGAQGLAGTINMKTVSPLDLAGRQLNFSIRGEKNSGGGTVPGTSEMGNRLSFSYVDQFADRTIGVAVGLSHLDSPNKSKYYNDWWWGNSAIWGGGFRGLENEDPTKAPSTLQGFETGVVSIDSKRDGLMAALEYKPNKVLHSQVDLFYSKFHQRSQAREFLADLGPDWSGNGTSDSPVAGGPIYSKVKTTVIDGFPIATSGSISNVDPKLTMRSGDRKDEVKSLGWNTELKVGDWKTSADLGYSKATRDETIGELYASATTLTDFQKFNANITSGPSQYVPSLNYGSGTAMQLRGIKGWWYAPGYEDLALAGSVSPIAVSDTMNSIRLSAKRDLEWGPINRFEGGVNYTDRKKSMLITQQAIALKNGTSCVNSSDLCGPIPSGILQSPADLAFAGMPALVSFDVNAALASGAYDSFTVRRDDAPGREWGVHEKVTTAFGKLGLEFEAFIPVHGNIGLQVVRTDQSSTGVVWDPEALQATSGQTYGKSYTDVLPSLNLIGELNTSTLIRFGAAKTLARPNLNDMRSGFTAGIPSTGASKGYWSGSGGNPFLEPWRATAVDLSLEKYFGKRSYVGAAVFGKKLQTSIYNDTMNFDFTGFPTNYVGTPKCLQGQTNCNIGLLDAPVNGKGGFIGGYELSAALDFGLLSKALDGFGTTFSYSHNHSNIAGHDKNGKPDITRSIEGMSGEVSAISAYYEKNGWTARIGQRYRSRYIAQVRSVWVTNSATAIEAERITDMKLGYGWESGALKGLSVDFEIGNLTNAPYRTLLNDDSYTEATGKQLLMPAAYSQYGRRYLLGLSYKY